MKATILNAICIMAASLLVAAAAYPAAPAAMSSITLDQAAPALGDTITVTTSVEKLKGFEYPMVDLQCYQDVNGDGFTDVGNLQSPDVVFTWLDQPNASFLLGGYSSIWTLRGGGGAECVANLDAFGWKAGAESVRILDSYRFHADA